MERVTYNAHCDALLRIEQGSKSAPAQKPAVAGNTTLTPERKAQCDKLIAADKAEQPATAERLQQFKQTR